MTRVAGYQLEIVTECCCSDLEVRIGETTARRF